MKGTPMDPDMNKYDSEHVITAHAHMSAEQWVAVYNAPGTSTTRRRTSRR